jgi:NAD(P)-dependent dehydrogenase (short-subunit alcohol dehydrogenase family)
MRGLQGKVVVVAGAGSGIGAAAAARLGEEGVSVVVGDVNGANAEKVAAGICASGGSAIAATFDIAEAESVDGLITAAVSAYGGIDGVHVNAADLSPETVGRDSDAVSLPLEVFDRTIAVDLRGHLLVTQRVVPELLARGGGAIVFTSSASAFMGARRLPSYAVAKSGLHALNRHVATRWGKEGIRANAIAPGFIRTATNLRGMRDDFQTKALKALPSPRLGEPDDIAAAVAFLLSDDGAWINGQVISVDGGLTMR